MPTAEMLGATVLRQSSCSLAALLGRSLSWVVVVVGGGGGRAGWAGQTGGDGARAFDSIVYIVALAIGAHEAVDNGGLAERGERWAEWAAGAMQNGVCAMRRRARLPLAWEIHRCVAVGRRHSRPTLWSWSEPRSRSLWACGGSLRDVGPSEPFRMLFFAEMVAAPQLAVGVRSSVDGLRPRRRRPRGVGAPLQRN